MKTFSPISHEEVVNKARSVVLMVKYPEIGQVKTRLAKSIGDSYALELYKRFVHDILCMLEKDRIHTQIAYTPQKQLPDFKRWLGEHYKYLPQTGESLGERLISVLKDSFSSGIEEVIALASDVPDLSCSIITRAFKALQESDSVIGPSPDGGYYLIGFRKNTFRDDVFKIDEWSTGDVLKDTVSKIENSGLTYAKLESWPDIDEIDDLRNMFQRNMNHVGMTSIQYLKDNMSILGTEQTQPHRESPYRSVYAR